jgi:hypothetical protein
VTRTHTCPLHTPLLLVTALGWHVSCTQLTTCGLHCVLAAWYDICVGFMRCCCCCVRVSSERLLPYYRDAKMLADRFDSFEIQHVYRCDTGRTALAAALGREKGGGGGLAAREGEGRGCHFLHD